MSITASEFLKWCQVFGIPINGGGGGNYQPNNGYQAYTLAITPNISIPNPAPTYIRVFGQTDNSSSVNLPNMSEPNAWPAGSIIYFFNDGNFITTLYDALDQAILVVPPKTIVTFVVTDNSSPGGFRFDISGAETFSQAQTNLQITGLQTTPLWFQPANVSGCAAGQTSFTNGVNIPYLQFADAVTTYSYAVALLPKRWNQSTFSLLASWYTPATSGTVVFKADAAITQLGSSLDLPFGTAVTVTSPAAGTANAPTNILTGAITPSGFASDNSWIVIRLYRDGSNGSDTLTNNAFIINPVEIRWTSNQGNDS